MEQHHILVVDDIEQNYLILQVILGKDYQLSWASSGLKALDMLKRGESKPDLILLDVMMPQLNGFETCQRLKESYITRNIPVIFMTALGEVRDEECGFEVGAVDYIVRPVNPGIVRARVKTHLALYDQQRELQRLVNERTEEIRHTQEVVIECLGRAAEYKDNETGRHVVRMSWYAYILAKAVGMDEQDAETLRQAAPMHDIGKIRIPDEILKCKGRLSADQMSLMKEHASYGAQLIGDHDSDLLKMAKTVALSHHEKWDGTGYPNGSQGDEIPLISRIVTIADVFDALTSRRPYKDAWSIDDAICYIEDKAGKDFDPELAPLVRESLPQIMQIYQQYADEEPEKGQDIAQWPEGEFAVRR